MTIATDIAAGSPTQSSSQSEHDKKRDNIVDDSGLGMLIFFSLSVNVYVYIYIFPLGVQGSRDIFLTAHALHVGWRRKSAL